MCRPGTCALPVRATKFERGRLRRRYICSSGSSEELPSSSGSAVHDLAIAGDILLSNRGEQSAEKLGRHLIAERVRSPSVQCRHQIERWDHKGQVHPRADDAVHVLGVGVAPTALSIGTDVGIPGNRGKLTDPGCGKDPPACPGALM